MVTFRSRNFRFYSCKPLTRLCLHLLLISIFGIIIYTISFRWKNENILLVDDSDHIEHGKNGEPTHYNPEEKKLVDESYKLYGFNQHVSDKISLTRTLKDFRHPQCSQVKYNILATSVSVIIVFYDEGWSTLIRTVMSVINRSPNHLLYEIILVDDHSTMSNA
ncbi:hypothetical protein MXB_3445 [Myxobolus squamalis]|nr:hypothetical protein MXB_3445 [Myxobolus squamalis]